MKPILTLAVLAFVAAGLSLTSAEAKGKNNGGSNGKKGNAVDAYLKAHDRNKNGTIEPTEYPGARAEFDKFDKNSDGKLDRSELSAMLSKK